MVENLVGYAKTDLMVAWQLTGGSGIDLVAANQAAAAWCVEVNAGVHSEICAIPAERLVAERGLLAGLPSLRPPWLASAGTGGRRSRRTGSRSEAPTSRSRPLTGLCAKARAATGRPGRRRRASLPPALTGPAHSLARFGWPARRTMSWSSICTGGRSSRAARPHSSKQPPMALADTGADIIVGTHAHVLLGSGWLGDTYVNYGLGNFLWYHDHQPESGVLGIRGPSPADRGLTCIGDSTAGSSTYAAPPSDSATSPTTLPDPYSRPADSDPDYTLDRE